jgi:hypothetical protein
MWWKTPAFIFHARWVQINSIYLRTLQLDYIFCYLSKNM